MDRRSPGRIAHDRRPRPVDAGSQNGVRSLAPRGAGKSRRGSHRKPAAGFHFDLFAGDHQPDHGSDLRRPVCDPGRHRRRRFRRQRGASGDRRIRRIGVLVVRVSVYRQSGAALPRWRLPNHRPDATRLRTGAGERALSGTRDRLEPVMILRKH